jgi:DNA-binding IscR family transcriptional regulator
MLARPASEITLGAVTRALEGPLAPISCVSVSGYMECGCPEPETCGLRVIWKEAREALAAVLDHTTFAEIQAKQEALTAERRALPDYQI